MLDGPQYLSWCQRFGFGQPTKKLIDQIRHSPPARRVGGGKKNVAGRYPSRKMGLTIQFESHSNELAAILDYEHDSDCLEFYDQPQPSIPLEYEAKNGRGLRVLHTADFFVLRTGSAGWVECKTEEDLVSLAQRSPGRFQGAGDGWRCPPGERYAGEFGLCYQIRSSRENNQVYRRNLEFLEDYLRCSTPTVARTVRDAILAAVTKRPGITVAELIRLSDSFGTG
jgi:putative transposase